MDLFAMTLRTRPDFASMPMSVDIAHELDRILSLTDPEPPDDGNKDSPVSQEQ